MTEEEILSLSSAIVDAYLHKASIYALTYVEPQFQTADYSDISSQFRSVKATGE